MLNRTKIPQVQAVDYWGGTGGNQEEPDAGSLGNTVGTQGGRCTNNAVLMKRFWLRREYSQEDSPRNIDLVIQGDKLAR